MINQMKISVPTRRVSVNFFRLDFQFTIIRRLKKSINSNIKKVEAKMRKMIHFQRVRIPKYSIRNSILSLYFLYFLP